MDLNIGLYDFLLIALICLYLILYKIRFGEQAKVYAYMQKDGVYVKEPHVIGYFSFLVLFLFFAFKRHTAGAPPPVNYALIGMVLFVWLARRRDVVIGGIPQESRKRR